jgi:valyl-tRNA synthetase
VPLTEEDSKRIAELQTLVGDVTDHIERFRIDIASDMVYHYIWDRFAAEIIEETKAILNDPNADPAARLSAQWTLYHILITSLKLLHPFMPYVTETIWQLLPQKDTDLLMISSWPTAQK